jgi:hypothetical protein
VVYPRDVAVVAQRREFQNGKAGGGGFVNLRCFNQLRGKFRFGAENVDSRIGTAVQRGHRDLWSPVQ